jgi:hypothetical protein
MQTASTCDETPIPGAQPTPARASRGLTALTFQMLR